MSLLAADFNKVRGGFEQVVGTLGVPVVWTQAIAPNATKTVTVGFKTAGKDDAAIVNAYGQSAVIMTFLAKDMTQAPVKFDEVALNGNRYTLDAVHEIHLNGILVGWKGMSRGVQS